MVKQGCLQYIRLGVTGVLSYIGNQKRSLVTSIQRHCLVKCLIVFLSLLLLFKIIQPSVFSYSISYLNVVINMVNNDMQRQQDVMRQQAELLWGYHQMQRRFMQNICKEKKLPPRKLLWLVSLSSDNVLPGAVAVAYSIKRISCYNKIGALVTSELTNSSLAILKQAGYELFHVESLDCNWMQKSMNVPQTNIGIPGTHTRFQAWSLVQFEKIIYIDIDFMLLTNIDELFDTPGDLSAVYGSRPGVVDPCFNAGLAVFRPSIKTRDELMSKWKELTSVLGCVSDQIVLWHYFAFRERWHELPYSYNVRRKLYYPMKAYHFAGYGVTPKPWNLEKPPTRKEAFDFPGPAVKREHMNILWWQLFYEALDEYKLHDWWASTAPSSHGYKKRVQNDSTSRLLSGAGSLS